MNGDELTQLVCSNIKRIRKEKGGLSKEKYFYGLKAMSFKDGAEFGYNKANAWHYVKDGDLPKDNKGEHFMNMNVDNWELADPCDDTQFYYESKLNDNMIACIVIPHKGNHFRWLLRIGFKSTFNKWGDVEYENTFDTFPLLADFMSNEKNLKEIELIKGE